MELREASSNTTNTLQAILHLMFGNFKLGGNTRKAFLWNIRHGKLGTLHLVLSNHLMLGNFKLGGNTPNMFMEVL